jgi:predicted transposase YdaD
MRAVVTKERLMESELYREIFGEGKAKGEARGEARGILNVLAARRIPVSDTIRERILACTDIATLDVWMRRAATAATAASVVRAARPAVPSAGRTRRHADKT